MNLLDSAAVPAAVGSMCVLANSLKTIHAHSLLFTVSCGNNTYVLYVDKHREHYAFTLYTSEPILKLTAPTNSFEHCRKVLILLNCFAQCRLFFITLLNSFASC